MTSPVAFSAVEDNNYSYLYYARKNGSIAVLKSDTTQEGNNTKYTPTSVIVSGNTVSSSSTNISAVAYKDDSGNRQVRVYYIGTAPTGDFQLRELVQTNGGDFTQGQLDKNSLAVSENSLISANVEFGKGDLKIFYQDKNGSPRVAGRRCLYVLGGEAK
ncbi:Fungal fucose-specific lectin [Microdochium nivale]|nr:Fungal fucose-specific lectin [Microdochium nivale]